MSELLRNRQRQLMAYLLQGDAAIAEHICEGGSAAKSTRLAIYANAYRKRLLETIDSDHPVLGIYLGDTLFEEMALGYIDRHPPQRPSLRHLGERLPDYLAHEDPFCRQPQIAELARFERLLMTVFDAADGARLSIAALRQLPAEVWPHLRLRFHPSARLFETRWNCVQTWQAIRAERAPPSPAPSENSWLLWRNCDRLTEFTSLGGAELAAVRAALDGADIAGLGERLLGWFPAGQAAGALVQLLQSWIERGWLSSIDQGA